MTSTVGQVSQLSAINLTPPLRHKRELLLTLGIRPLPARLVIPHLRMRESTENNNGF
jgi:hypothetical protein